MASIVLFAALGRRAHSGTGGFVATLEVAAPFVVGWLVAAFVVGVHRRPAAVAPALRALALGLPLGLALRAATGGGVAPAFVAVAVVVNAATLVGRRILAGRLARRRAGRAGPLPPGTRPRARA